MEAHDFIAPAVLIGGGFAVGLLVGRWWTLALAVGVGVWAALTTTELEVSGAWFGIVYAAMSAAGIASGVAARRILRRFPTADR